MAKRLSASAPKPRPHFPFPGYPTVAAAGLYLCLSGGCSRDPGLNNRGNTAGTRENTGGTTSTGGATSTGGTTSTGGYLAGGVGPPFEPLAADAEAPDPVAPTPDAAVPDVVEPPSPQDAADLAPALPDPTGGGGAPIPQ